jgi:hypothetical protein
MPQNEGGLGLIKVSKFIEFIKLNVTAILSLLMKIFLVDTSSLSSRNSVHKKNFKKL